MTVANPKISYEEGLPALEAFRTFVAALSDDECDGGMNIVRGAISTIKMESTPMNYVEAVKCNMKFSNFQKVGLQNIVFASCTSPAILCPIEHTLFFILSTLPG